MLEESGTEEKGIKDFRRSVIYNQEGRQRESESFMFESYFVECETNQLRKLKRVQYLSSLTNFLTNVSSFVDEKQEVRSTNPLGRRSEASQESSDTFVKTMSSLFFVSKLNSSEKVSSLNKDWVII